MKAKVILVNFQNEYLSKKGKWYSKNKISSFILDRFIPFCKRNKLNVYEIQSDYSTPNYVKQNGCVPGTYGFKSLLSDSSRTGSPFIKCDNSPNFVRINHGESPVERPEEFKHWLDENIGDPSQIAYVLLLGMGLESSIAMVGSEMAKYGYKIKILKEATGTTNKKYTEFLLDKFPLVSWGSVVSFTNFVKEMKKYAKIIPVESGWRPSQTVNAPAEPRIIQEETPTYEQPKEYIEEPVFEEEEEEIIEPIIAEPKEEKKANVPSFNVNEDMSKAEAISMMKEQMKAQYLAEKETSSETPKQEQPSIKKSKEYQADQARRRVEEYYRKMAGEDTPTDEVASVSSVEETTEVKNNVVEQEKTNIKVEPVTAVELEDLFLAEEDETEEDQSALELDEFLNEEIENDEVEPLIVNPEPIVKEVVVKVPRPNPNAQKYGYIFDSMIYVENKIYKERKKETIPANFVKSKILNGQEGVTKTIKPKTININKISVHEKYMLEEAKKKKDLSLNKQNSSNKSEK